MVIGAFSFSIGRTLEAALLTEDLDSSADYSARELALQGSID